MATLTPTLLNNGVAQYTLSGQNNLIASYPLKGVNIVKSYIFAASSCPVVDIAAVNNDGSYTPIAELHRFAVHGFSPGQYASPNWANGFADMWSGENERNFFNDSISSNGIDLYAYGAHGWLNVYLVIWTRPTA